MVHGTGNHKIIKSGSGVYPVQIKNQTDYFRNTICKGAGSLPLLRDFFIKSAFRLSA